ncbi:MULTISPECIES: FHA domain-containing protein FhaB/FipA [Actinoallomurus]|uniref:FHA domain-containing protein FhaB/FipA n=1 Tax=Actinoallomurus TaxID=667113 RepID=UPI002092CD8D|nr:FHA domain-containing protein [Actinoallomurus rhizosphaericola]MCO5970275.1 FHA domain-containing protein [Actinoallomurus soli]MCO5998587.1 FHA domain-containing protein [Actinoallomurus rhizosphaericola]
MNQITLTLMKVAFLAVLWLFVIAAAGVIRADLWGSKAAAKAQRPRQAAQPARPPRQAAAPRVRRAEPTKLVITEGARAGTTMDLVGTEITMGRSNDVTLPLGDDYSSGRHARLFSQNGQWFVEDLGSTNGTFLGRAKVSRPEPVPVGVPIRIGKTVIELRK